MTAKRDCGTTKEAVSETPFKQITRGYMRRTHRGEEEVVGEDRWEEEGKKREEDGTEEELIDGIVV